MIKENNPLILKALNFFVENPYEKIHLREFSRKMDLSLNSVQRFLKVFLKKGWIKEERVANLRYFYANLDSIVFRQIKITFSLDKIKESGLIEFLERDFDSVVLYGSVAKGLDESKSDLDLVCIGKEKSGRKDIYKFSKRIGKEISIQFFSQSKWRDAKINNKAFYQDVISSGINLVGEMPI